MDKLQLYKLNTIKKLNSSTKAMECGLIVLQTIFGANKCEQIRKQYNNCVGMYPKTMYDFFKKNAKGKIVEFRQIDYDTLKVTLQSDEIYVLFIQTKRFFMRMGHFTFVFKQNGELYIWDRTIDGNKDSDKSPFDEYFEKYDYDFHNIQILYKIKKPKQSKK